jgi:Ca-activated chloride channel family protein
MKLDPLQRGHMPDVAPAEPFAPPGSHVRGWKVKIPGGRPLATPAVENGNVYLGGGFGSYEFYAFRADTGALAWRYQTEDDGPTAAVVADGRVVFNTESCELEVLTEAGERVWKLWLGDPLLSMPAVADGCVFIAFPDSRGDRRHYLAAFDLHAGRELWRHPIAGELITCPVLADGHVYATCLDGTLNCFDRVSGALLWTEQKNATSSPSVWNGRCYFSERTEEERRTGAGVETQRMERLSRKRSGVGTPTESYHTTTAAADYLDHGKRAARSAEYRAHAAYDSSVGFGGHQGDMKAHQSVGNLGTGHVSAVWAYQGSKPVLARGRMYTGHGAAVHCVEPESHEVVWKRAVREGAGEVLDAATTPPAVVNGKLFLGTTDGRLLCLAAATGDEVWAAELGEPVVFQPAVAGGRVFVGTRNGTLFGLSTGDPGDDGWRMWGATPAHNGRAEG